MYAPDGRGLAVAGGTYTGLHPPAAYTDFAVSVLRSTDTQVLWRSPAHADSGWAVAWSPDGRG